MNIEDIEKELLKIKSFAYKHDDECAHRTEDRLHQKVLAFIAEGTCENAQLYAQLALTSISIDFARWCA